MDMQQKNLLLFIRQSTQCILQGQLNFISIKIRVWFQWLTAGYSSWSSTKSYWNFLFRSMNVKLSFVAIDKARLKDCFCSNCSMLRYTLINVVCRYIVCIVMRKNHSSNMPIQLLLIFFYKGSESFFPGFLGFDPFQELCILPLVLLRAIQFIDLIFNWLFNSTIRIHNFI